MAHYRCPLGFQIPLQLFSSGFFTASLLLPKRHTETSKSPSHRIQWIDVTSRPQLNQKSTTAPISQMMALTCNLMFQTITVDPYGKEQANRLDKCWQSAFLQNPDRLKHYISLCCNLKSFLVSVLCSGNTHLFRIRHNTWLACGKEMFRPTLFRHGTARYCPSVSGFMLTFIC